MEQKDIENLKSKEYITERGKGNETIYPLSLLGVEVLTKNIAESKLVDVEYLTVNKLEDIDINKFKQNSTKPKFIFCFLNKTKEETGKKAEKKREKESKTEENIPEHHFLPIILFNGKKYIFDLDLRNIEDSEFVKNINDDNTFIFNVKPNNTDKKYTRGQLIQADEYNCGTNTVEVAQQIYEHYIKYFYYEEYKKIYREKYKKEYTKKSIPENERIDKFENYLQKEIKLDGKFVLLSQSSGTINKYLQKLHENIKNQPDTEQEKWIKYVKKLKQISILCKTLKTEKKKLFGKLSSEETESGKQAEEQIGKLKKQKIEQKSLQKEIDELKQQHKKYFSIINLKTLQTNIDRGISSAFRNVYGINCGKCENITPLQTIYNIRDKHETLLKDDTQAKEFHSFQK